jgi:hypothetical protein
MSLEAVEVAQLKLSGWYALGRKQPLRLKLLSKARFRIKARRELATAAFQQD